MITEDIYIKPKRWKYKPSEKVRKYVSRLKGNNRIAEFSNALGDRGKYFAQNELDDMYAIFLLGGLNLIMPHIDRYIADTNPNKLQALLDEMYNRMAMNYMTNSSGYQLPDSRKVIFPLQRLEAVKPQLFVQQPIIRQPERAYVQPTINNQMSQQDIWDVFDRGAIAYGNLPKQVLPSIGDMISDGKNKYFAEMLGLNSIYDTGNLNYEFAPFMISAKNGKLPRFEDGNTPNIPGPVTVLGNVANSVINPKLTIERLMRQRADGTRDVEDVLRAVLLNQGGDYTGHEGGPMNNRDLVGLYLYGNDKGFKKINPADNIGHSYDNEIIASGRDPRNINTYYGKFPVKNGPIILPKYAEQLVRALAASGIPVTKQLDSKPADGFDDVARFLATLTLKNGQPVVSYSDMWDFMPDQYSSEYGKNFWHYMQAYAADKAGTPFILRQTVPIEFSGENSQRIFANDLDNPDLETSILLKAGVLPEVNVYPEPKVLTPKQRKERKAKLEAAFLEQLKEMSTWKNGKLPKLKSLWKR